MGMRIINVTCLTRMGWDWVGAESGIGRVGGKESFGHRRTLLDSTYMYYISHPLHYSHSISHEAVYLAGSLSLSGLSETSWERGESPNEPGNWSHVCVNIGFRVVGVVGTGKTRVPFGTDTHRRVRHKHIRLRDQAW